MSNKNAVVGQGQRQMTKSLKEQIDQLNQSFVQLVVNINEQFEKYESRLNAQREVTEALSELSGREEVAKIITDTRIALARTEAASEKQALEEGIKGGYVLPVDMVTDDSMVVGRFIKPDGTVEEPGRFQYVMRGLHSDFRAKLLGQKWGTKVQLPAGATFELLEAYTVDAEKEKVYQEQQLQAAKDAVQKAEEVSANDQAQDAAAVESAIAEGA